MLLVINVGYILALALVQLEIYRISSQKNVITNVMFVPCVIPYISFVSESLTKLVNSVRELRSKTNFLNSNFLK